MTEGGPSPGIAAPVVGLGLVVDVARHGGTWTESGITDALLERAARAALAAALALPGHYDVTIVLADDTEMRDLNRTWRGKDAATNVLSFPADNTVQGPGFLGDIVLAYETTLREAREENFAFADHVSHLVVHGMLHLLGFDHAQDGEAERMESIERNALATLGIADPYAEDIRTSLPELLS